MQRKSASSNPEIRETCPYFGILPRQTGLERTDYSAVKSITLPAFLWRGHEQSGFKKGIRRMECDQKPEIRA
jgi:hypothetical protein